jgi:hypothetical protein
VWFSQIAIRLINWQLTIFHKSSPAVVFTALFASLLAVSACSFFFWKQRPRAEISGTWIAEMKKANQPTFRVGLNFASLGGKITGSVSYPMGDGGIQGGTLERVSIEGEKAFPVQPTGPIQ